MRNEEHRAGWGGTRAGATPGTRLGRPPLFQVVAGQPTPEEVAALTAALTVKRAAAARAAAQTRPAVRGWMDRRHRLRLPPAPGPGAWRRSGLPR